MELLIHIEGAEDELELHSLEGWLRDEPELRGTARLSRLAAPPLPGEMGGGLDTLQVVFTDAVSASSLVVAIAAWLDNHRKSKARGSEATDVVIQRGDTRIAVSGRSLEEVLEALDQQDGASS